MATQKLDLILIFPLVIGTIIFLIGFAGVIWYIPRPPFYQEQATQLLFTLIAVIGVIPLAIGFAGLKYLSVSKK